ncbi:MAG: hypothetical protein HQ522_16630 [Bacteroidetes bacterium]|nr:hypothetical protein [Bacteroidota bacterium]
MDQYEYFSANNASFPEVEAMHRITGLRELEETLEEIRNHKPFMMLVEDDDDGYLSFEGGNSDNGFRTFYIVGQAKLNDSTDRKLIQRQCKAIALKVFKQIMADAQNFGDPCYGFDRSRIDYRRIGPLISNYYGFAFSYILVDENFNLV